MSEVTVEMSALRAAAEEVEGIATDLRTAAGNGASAQRLSDDAFGLLCKPMAAVANSAQSGNVNAINVMAEAVESTATSTSAAADDYDATDSGTATSLDAVEGSI